MLDRIPLLTLSGFRSPNVRPTEYGEIQPAVVISSGDLILNMAHSCREFTITIQHPLPPFSPATPFGVQLSLPLNYLASLFILDHGIHGRSIRIRLISPSQAFKLDKYSTVPAHKRFMLDEHEQPVLLYPWNLNDHFDLLGILQGREFVAQIPSTISMERLVDWGARLKDAAASVDGTVVQVLFDNVDTGRVSQLQNLPAQLRNNPFCSQSHKSGSSPHNSRRPENRQLNHRDRTSTTSPSATRSSCSDESFGRLTPYHSHSKRPRSDSASSDTHVDEERFWAVRQRLLRPNSPGRYYRPKGSSSTSPHHDLKDRRGHRRQRSSHDKDKREVSADSNSPDLKAEEIKVEVIKPDMAESEIKVEAS